MRENYPLSSRNMFRQYVSFSARNLSTDQNTFQRTIKFACIFSCQSCAINRLHTVFLLINYPTSNSRSDTRARRIDLSRCRIPRSPCRQAQAWSHADISNERNISALVFTANRPTRNYRDTAGIQSPSLSRELNF